jgi:hypothetical protein
MKWVHSKISLITFFTKQKAACDYYHYTSVDIQIKRHVCDRLAVAFGLKSSSFVKLQSPHDVDKSLLRSTDRTNNCTQQSTLGTEQRDISCSTVYNDDQPLAGGVKVDDQRIRSCMLVNVAEGSTCTSTSMTQAEDPINYKSRQLERTKGEDTGWRINDAVKETSSDDWLLAARVVDRLCFILFSVCLIIGTFAVSLLAALG